MHDQPNGIAGHFRRFLVDPAALTLTLQTGTLHRIDDGIPRNSDLVSHGYDPKRDDFYLTVEHESFDPVEEHEEIPEDTVTLTDIDPDRLRED